jgi:hypothetical protein
VLKSLLLTISPYLKPCSIAPASPLTVPGTIDKGCLGRITTMRPLDVQDVVIDDYRLQ